MPLRQVRVEYDQYELRRRLVSQFDLFLSDGRIAGHMLHLLGKEVYKRRKSVPLSLMDFYVFVFPTLKKGDFHCFSWK
jgi:ribosome biogenesis protein UTP30